MKISAVLIILFLFSVIAKPSYGQQEDDSLCVDSITPKHLLNHKFVLSEIIFTKKKHEVAGKPYDWIAFDSTTVTFYKSDGTSYSGTYFIYRDIIYFEINPMEKGSFAVNCYNNKYMSVNVYYFDNKSNKMQTAHRAFVFNIE